MSAENSNKQPLLKYLGLGTQLGVGLWLMVVLGKWIDQKWMGQKPILTWVLPLLFIFGTLYKIINDTSKPNHEK